MKKSILIILFTLGVQIILAQDYLINFSGSGASTEISAIQVENLTSGASVTLNGGDVLHLKSSLGIDFQKINNNHLKIYPNPMTNRSIMTFSAPDNGEAVMFVIDISGKLVYQISENVSNGENSFSVSGIDQGLYLLTITGNNYSYSAKLISQNKSQGEAKIEWLSSNEDIKSAALKEVATTIDMIYTAGDLLLYKGTSGQYGTVITDVPTVSKTMTFNFVLCQDGDGNNYTTVQVGTQLWMVENLKTTKYNDGAPIPLVTDNTIWSNSDSALYCWYNNDISNKNSSGALYNWYTVKTGRLAPAGWHVPTDEELTILTNYLGGESIAGGKLKETGTTNWRTPNAGATNESGFTALPAGHRDINGSFVAMGDDGYWWSNTEYGTTGKVWYRNLDYNNAGIISANNNKKNGQSVRCVQNLGDFFIGQAFGGGIIFYIDSTGQHGLISAPSDQSSSSVWGCSGTSIPGTSLEIGAGQTNTTAIVSGCAETGIAAQICNDLLLNGYDDWFLPSFNELYQMFLQKSVIGGFASDNFWSSSEREATDSFAVNFGAGNGFTFLKDNTALHVRAVRAF